MPTGPQRALLIALAILLAVLPLVEIVDHWEIVDQWESNGSDPEFVSVCTVLGIAFGSLLLLRRAILYCLYWLSRLLPRRFSLRPSAASVVISPDDAQVIFARIRAPIRI